MPRILAIALVLLFIAQPVAIGQQCKPPSRTKAKSTSKSKKARTRRNEAKAAAQLEKAKSLLNAGKRKKVMIQLRKIARRYPGTKASVEAAVILTFSTRKP